MAFCEKCSAEIPDGVTLCENCAAKDQPAVNMWARPGAVPNSGNTYVKAEEVKPAPVKAAADPEPQPQPDTAGQESDEQAEDDQSGYRAGGELDRRVKQTEYFNTVANVDDERQLTDINELLQGSSLLEVPFNDTEYNIGYTIPKMKLSVPKRTRRKIFTGAAIFSGVALLIAAFIFLDSVFGILPRTVEVPVMYEKYGKPYLTSSTGKLPSEIKYDGKASQISFGTQRILFSPYSEDVFVKTNYVAKSGSYSLYIRRSGEIDNQGVLIDTNIIGDFRYVCGGKGIVYVKGMSTTDLYIYDIESGESSKLDKYVSKCSQLDDDTVVYITTKGNIRMLDVGSETPAEPKDIVLAAKSVYFDDDPCDSFFFLKVNRNTETGQNESVLYRYSDGKIAESVFGVNKVITYSCKDDWAYCTSNNEDEIYLSEFIDDDCAESDGEIIGSIQMSFDMPASQANVLRRENLRQRAFGKTYELETTTLYFYSKGQSDIVCDRCSEILLTADGKVDSVKSEALKSQISTRYGGTGIVYSVLDMQFSQIKMSEVPTEMLGTNTFISYVGTQIETAKKHTLKEVFVDGKKAQLNNTSFKSENFAFSKDGKTAYYIDMSEDSDCGDLMQLASDGKGFKAAEAIAVDVKSFTVLADGMVVYFDSNGTAFAGSVAIAQRVSGYSVSQDASALALLAETSETGSRLVIFRESKAKAIADSVKAVCFNSENVISFIKDYDKVYASGDLYICKNFNTVTRIDSDVSGLINLKY